MDPHDFCILTVYSIDVRTVDSQIITVEYALTLHVGPYIRTVIIL